MNLKCIASFLLISFLAMSACADTNSSDQIATTEKYEFYSNFWINQHHFLYAKAVSASKGNWDDGFTDGDLGTLNTSEREVLKEAIVFYRDSVISYDLLFNRGLSRLKRALIDFDEEESFQIEDLSDELVEQLNEVKSIYRKYFWEKHNQSNIDVVQKHLDFTLEYESQIFDRVSELAQQPWRDGKVRVDVSYYANWAGAYTSTEPEVHVVITSQDEGNGDWLELLFHEPCHSIMSSRRYKTAELISKVSERLDMNPPRSLWHSLLFYFSGITVKEALEKEGIDYEIYMIRNDVFGRHHEVIFKHMPAYVNGDVTYETAIENLIRDYNE